MRLLALLLLTSNIFAQAPAGGQQNAPVGEPAVLDGIVTNATTGEGIRKVSLSLSPSKSSGTTYTSTSDASGQFHFEGVQAGEYRLSGQRAGFMGGSMGWSFISPRGSVSIPGGAPVKVSAGEHRTDLSLRLTPQSVISGKVTDEDGDPVPNAYIMAYAQIWIRGQQRLMMHGGSSTNDLGEYRMGNLRPGKYYVTASSTGTGAGMMMGPRGPGGNKVVNASGKPDNQPVMTFFPGSANIESATPIAVQGGQDVPGTDIRLLSAPGFRVSGKVTGGTGEGGPGFVMLQPQLANSVGGAMFGNHNAAVQPDGSFTLLNVTPGSYIARANKGGGPRNGLIGTAIVEVAAGDVSGIVINLGAGSSVTGKLTVEGNVSVQPGSIRVTMQNLSGSMQGGDIFSPNPVQQDGSFSFQNVSPGRYQAQVLPVPEGSYVKSIRFNQQEARNIGFDVTEGGGTHELVVVLAAGGGTVDGQIQAGTNTQANGAPESQATGASILLMPQEIHPDGTGKMFGTADGSGHFTLKSVPPGKYFVFAGSEWDTNLFENPDFVRQISGKAASVEVSGNGQVSAQVPLISKEELQDLMAKTGL